jgi:predicted ribosomally synthesized peptide with SipW-like signal peptide
MVRAILAGGLVLGVGAAITLASWNDSEFATGTFAAGSFNIQGTSGDPAATPTWADHATSGTAQSLTFKVNADTLSPGQTVYAPFSLRVDSAKQSYDATVVPNAMNPVTLSGDLATFLTAATYVSTYSDCVAGTPGTTKLTSLTLAKDGPSQTLCLAVSLTDGDVAAQGKTGTAVWQFDATSVAN